VPGKVVSLRLEEGLLRRVDGRARELGKSRTEFLTWAMENALDDAGRGVPNVSKAKVENLAENERGEIVKIDPEKPASFELPKPKPEPADVTSENWHTWAMHRQQKLNADKERRG
jgi:predicted transcriptional regulator